MCLLKTYNERIHTHKHTHTNLLWPWMWQVSKWLFEFDFYTWYIFLLFFWFSNCLLRTRVKSNFFSFSYIHKSAHGKKFVLLVSNVLSVCLSIFHLRSYEWHMTNVIWDKPLVHLSRIFRFLFLSSLSFSFSLIETQCQWMC